MRISDWSSDVCSSDLRIDRHAAIVERETGVAAEADAVARTEFRAFAGQIAADRAIEPRHVIARQLVALAIFDRPDDVEAIAFETERSRDALVDARADFGHVDLAFDVQAAKLVIGDDVDDRSEEHTSELQSLMRISYAVFCLKKK